MPPIRARVLALLLLAVVVIASAAFLPAKELLARLFTWAEELGPWGAFLVAGLYVPGSVLCVPGTPITFTCAFGFGFAAALPPIVLFTNLGAQAAFLLGRTLVRERVERRVRSQRRLAAVDRAVGEQGFRIVVLLRLSPLLPFNLLNYVLGASPVRFRDYALGTFLGMLPGNVVYCTVGAALGTLAQALAGETEIGTPGKALFGVGLAATIAAAVLVQRRASRALAGALDGEAAPPSA